MEETCQTASRMHLCHPDLRSPSPPDLCKDSTKNSTKRSHRNHRLFLKLRCLRSLPLDPPPPQTPHNTSYPLFMKPAQNAVRRAAFEKHVRVGATPLLGKSRQVGKRKRKGRDISDILKELELKEWRFIRKDNGEKDSVRLLWLKARLWGRGRWATRSQSGHSR